jgi:hypothetical protein
MFKRLIAINLLRDKLVADEIGGHGTALTLAEVDMQRATFQSEGPGDIRIHADAELLGIAIALAVTAREGVCEFTNIAPVEGQAGILQARAAAVRVVRHRRAGQETVQRGTLRVRRVRKALRRRAAQENRLLKLI